MILLFFVVVTGDLVQSPLDVRHFARDGIDGRERPAGEVPHRLCGVDMLGPGGLVDRERVVAKRFGLEIYFGDFGFAGPTAVAQNDRAGVGKALVAIDRCGIFSCEKLSYGIKSTRHRVL